MNLLKQTKEYQDFANFVEDSGGNVRGLDKEIQLPGDAPDDDNWVP